jgi:four helix bundle protein
VLKTVSRGDRFEDLEVWKAARALTQSIYRATAGGGFERDLALRDQIRRAAVSTMSNIAEGFERGGDKEFLQFLAQAKGSCGVVRSQLYTARDLGYLSQSDFGAMTSRAILTSRLISGLMKYLRDSGFRGSKFRSA